MAEYAFRRGYRVDPDCSSRSAPPPVWRRYERLDSLRPLASSVVSGAPSLSAPRLIVRESQSQKAGRRFQPGPEARLEPAARRAIKNLPGAQQGVVAVRELSGPFGVPDFVALVGGKHRLELRSKLGVPAVLNEVDARILTATPSRGSTTIGDLEMVVPLPRLLTQRRVAHLTRVGALLRTGAGRLRRPGALGPLGSIYAIEMKVADVRRGIAQCRRYHVWADSYVLIMGMLSDVQLEQAQVVKADGGGLVVDGRMIYRARARRSAAAWQRLLASEHFFAATRAPSPR